MLRFRPWAISRNKYNNKKTVVDGFTFDSKKEANYYLGLKQDKANGKILLILRQVPFHLACGVKYVLDFLVFWATGDVEFIDAKGVRTQEYIIKKKMVEHEHGIEIKEV